MLTKQKSIDNRISWSVILRALTNNLNKFMTEQNFHSNKTLFCTLAPTKLRLESAQDI
jgi:hypothetical protein